MTRLDVIWRYYLHEYRIKSTKHITLSSPWNRNGKELIPFSFFKQAVHYPFHWNFSSLFLRKTRGTLVQESESFVRQNW
jgi:hypothetical protein